jgi:hypothetical protein
MKNNGINGANHGGVNGMKQNENGVKIKQNQRKMVINNGHGVIIRRK